MTALSLKQQQVKPTNASSPCLRPLSRMERQVYLSVRDKPLTERLAYRLHCRSFFVAKGSCSETYLCCRRLPMCYPVHAIDVLPSLLQARDQWNALHDDTIHQLGS